MMNAQLVGVSRSAKLNCQTERFGSCDAQQWNHSCFAHFVWAVPTIYQNYSHTHIVLYFALSFSGLTLFFHTIRPKWLKQNIYFSYGFRVIVTYWTIRISMECNNLSKSVACCRLCCEALWGAALPLIALTEFRMVPMRLCGIYFMYSTWHTD